MRWTRAHRAGRRIAAVALATLAAVLLAACGSLSQTGPSAQGGSLAQGVSLQGQSYNVGGKQFTEQLILCEMTIAALQSVGATANNRCGIAGSVPTRAALTSGQIDMYWEYTGTAWITYLQETKPIPESQQQYEAVKQRDARNNIVWLNPTPFENTYAIAVKNATADRLGVKTLSDLARLANSGSPEATLCVAQEFVGRSDGLPGLQQTYGFQLPAEKIKTLDEGPIYQAVANGDPCIFGEVFTTDGRIPTLGLTVLQDDKSFFPKYNAAVTIRKEAFDRNPDIAKVFNPIAARLTNEVMQSLNRQKDQEGKMPRDVARQWLQQQGFIGSG